MECWPRCALLHCRICGAATTCSARGDLTQLACHPVKRADGPSWVVLAGWCWLGAGWVAKMMPHDDDDAPPAGPAGWYDGAVAAAAPAANRAKSLAAAVVPEFVPGLPFFVPSSSVKVPSTAVSPTEAAAAALCAASSEQLTTTAVRSATEPAPAPAPAATTPEFTPGQPFFRPSKPHSTSRRPCPPTAAAADPTAPEFTPGRPFFLPRKAAGESSSSGWRDLGRARTNAMPGGGGGERIAVDITASSTTAPLVRRRRRTLLRSWSWGERERRCAKNAHPLPLINNQLLRAPPPAQLHGRGGGVTAAVAGSHYCGRPRLTNGQSGDWRPSCLPCGVRCR